MRKSPYFLAEAGLALALVYAHLGQTFSKGFTSLGCSGI